MRRPSGSGSSTERHKAHAGRLEFDSSFDHRVSGELASRPSRALSLQERARMTSSSAPVSSIGAWLSPFVA